jgi:hypothetical protein
MRERYATILGLALAPIVPAATGALTSSGLGGGIEGDLVTNLGLTFLFYFYAIIPVFLIGAPVFLLLRRFNFVRWWSAAGVGFLIGLVVVAVLVSGDFSRTTFLSTLLFCCSGAFGAVLFWLVWSTSQRAQHA